MVTLYDTEVDGVRCFWVETGRPTLAAQLLFRQGMADEWLVEAGWQHMLEHLALHGRGGGALTVNGSVSLLLTTFEAHGPPDLVAAHFTALTRWLARPEFHEFDRERGVLRAEAQLRGVGPQLRALGWRYGSLGPGTAAFNEPGIARSTPEALTARAQRAFGRGNAVLVLDGPPPPGLRLDLPDGPLVRPPMAIPCEETLPAMYVDESGLIMTGVVPRSSNATFVPELLQRALREQLRDRAGGAYAPWCSYEPVDDSHALILAGSDLSPELLPSVAESALDIARRLATLGPPHADLEEMKAARAQALRDPYAAFGVAVRAGQAVLGSQAPQTFEELLDEVYAPGTKTVKEDLRRFRESMMLGLPGRSAWADQLPRLGFPTATPAIKGTRSRHRDWPAVSTSLVVGDSGVELVDGATARSIAFADATGVLTFQDGARSIISHEGWTIDVEPGEWVRGDRLVAHLDRVTPPLLGIPAGERPERPGARMSVTRRWGVWLRRNVSGRFGTPVLSMLGFTLLLLGALAAIVAGRPGLGVMWVILLATAAALRFIRRFSRPSSPRHRGG